MDLTKVFFCLLPLNMIKIRSFCSQSPRFWHFLMAQFQEGNILFNKAIRTKALKTIRSTDCHTGSTDLLSGRDNSQLSTIRVFNFKSAGQSLHHYKGHYLSLFLKTIRANSFKTIRANTYKTIRANSFKTIRANTFKTIRANTFTTIRANTFNTIRAKRIRTIY